jgi:hypothetical protein
MKQFFVPLQSFLIPSCSLIPASASSFFDKRANKNKFSLGFNTNPSLFIKDYGQVVPDTLSQGPSWYALKGSSQRLNLPGFAAAGF